MNIYAYIQDGLLHWKFESEEPPEFAPNITIVDITGEHPMPEEGWLFDGQAFSPPPPPSAEELLARAQGRLMAERKVADDAIAPLQDAIDLDEATEEEIARLKLWKKYRIALSRVVEQTGYPQAIEWPVAPA
ncbi:tail fiber assembly protein [Pseudomonas akapageensis]|uniref:tail fiber assembly protein n=1 Tax=Pseudomonas akapageensis TaxID=2609961 RepID=UPI00140D50A2|nr:tail fiber assembly protein [Pseudomonas akapageensis]